MHAFIRLAQVCMTLMSVYNTGFYSAEAGLYDLTQAPILWSVSMTKNL